MGLTSPKTMEKISQTSAKQDITFAEKPKKEKRFTSLAVKAELEN
jgi:hypothetical protein